MKERKNWKRKKIEQAIQHYGKLFEGREQELSLIRRDLLDGIDAGQVMNYAQENHSFQRMQLWSNCLRNHYTKEMIAKIFKPEFTDEKCEILVKQYEAGVSGKDLDASMGMEFSEDRLDETGSHVEVEVETVQQSMDIHGSDAEIQRMKELVEESVSKKHADEVVHAVGTAMDEGAVTLDEELAKLRKANRKLRGEKEKLFARVKGLEQENDQKESEYRALAEENRKLLREKEKLLSESQTEQGDREKLCRQADELQQQLAQLQNQLDNQQKQLAQLRNEKNSLSAEKQDWENQCASYESQLHFLHTQMEQTKQQESTQGVSISLETHEKIMAENKKVMEEYMQKYQAANALLSKEKTIRQETEQEFSEAQDKINRLDGANKKLEKELRDFKESTHSGQETVSDLKSQLAEQKQKVTGLEEKLVKKDGTIAALRGELKAQKEKVESLQKPDKKEPAVSAVGVGDDGKIPDFRYSFSTPPKVTVQEESVEKRKEEPMYQMDYNAVVYGKNGPITVPVERTRKKRGGLFGFAAGIFTGGKNKTFIRELQGKNISEEQFREIRKGIECGLDEEQVRALIDGNFTPEAIRQIIGIAIAIDNR